MPPSISVVMPVFNAGRYLRQALDSVLGQTLRDFELLAVCGPSSDDSAALLVQYAGRDPRVRVVEQTGAGIVGALNCGLALARGEFVARMDADDVALPERFQAQIAFLQHEPACVAVGSQALQIDPQGDAIGPMRVPLTHEEIDRRNLAGIGGGIPHPTAMIRRRVIEAIGGYSPAYHAAEDLDFFLRLAEVGRLANLPDTLLLYRLHLHSASVARRRETLAAARLAVAAACRRRGIADAGGPLPPGAQACPRQFDVQRAWAWSAVEAGHPATARKYALRVLCRNFWFHESWRLAEAAFVGMGRTVADGKVSWRQTLRQSLLTAVLRGGTLCTKLLRLMVRGRWSAAPHRGA